jgi:VIT1/CCC1 family predicted Fe2+/Mn2+ transporter
VFRDLGLSIAQKQLTPGESLSEVLFGLIMTLTFTLGAGILVREDPSAARDLLIATVGCNVAWGIIDGAFYVAGQIFERGRLARLGARIRAAATEEAAAALVAEELEDLVGLTFHPAEHADLYRRVARYVRGAQPRGVATSRADLYGAFASFWLVFLSSVPAALPFLVIPDQPWVALRVSNGILIAGLFVIGFRWARYTTLHPWLTGLAFLVLGIGLVGVTVALGG